MYVREEVTDLLSRVSKYTGQSNIECVRTHCSIKSSVFYENGGLAVLGL